MRRSLRFIPGGGDALEPRIAPSQAGALAPTARGAIRIAVPADSPLLNPARVRQPNVVDGTFTTIPQPLRTTGLKLATGGSSLHAAGAGTRVQGTTLPLTSVRSTRASQTGPARVAPPTTRPSPFSLRTQAHPSAGAAPVLASALVPRRPI